MSSQDAMRNFINSKMVETGEKDRLKEMLRQKLVESGWKDEMKDYCKNVTKQKGLEKAAAEDVVNELLPHGRTQVPAAVRAELQTKVRKFLVTSNAGNYR